MSPENSNRPEAEQHLASARAELEARAKRHAAEVVERWKATLRQAFDPSEDEGAFDDWNDTGDPDVDENWRPGFARYSGHSWARQTEAGWFFELVRSNIGADRFTPQEWAIIRGSFFNTEKRTPPASRRWVLVEDKEAVAPIDLPSPERECERWKREAQAFAEQYRASLPEPMRRLGLVLGLEPGAPVHAALWLGEDRTPHAIDAWLSAVAAERFQRLDCTSLGYWTALEPAAKPRALAELVSAPSGAPLRVYESGIARLDELRGGLFQGDRVVIQAATGNAKTALALALAEHLAAMGLAVGWIATRDEVVESIRARRLQRHGYSMLDAKAHAKDPAALATLNANLVVIDGREWFLEDVLAAGGAGPDVLFIDNIQKVKSRAGKGLGELASIEAALNVIETSGVTTVMTSKMVRGSRNRPRIEGSYGGAAIETGATLLLDLTLKASTLSVGVLKARGAGEGERFELVLDREGQTLSAPVPDELAAVKAAIVAALEERGTLSGAGVERWVPGDTRRTRAALAALVAAGDIVKTPSGYEVAK